MTWNGAAWHYADAFRSLTLTCAIYELTGAPLWTLVATVIDPGGCICTWMSFENGGGRPDCGVTCGGGTFDVDCWDSGPPGDCAAGSVVIWPI
jgi:hypothetical protein